MLKKRCFLWRPFLIDMVSNPLPRSSTSAFCTNHSSNIRYSTYMELISKPTYCTNALDFRTNLVYRSNNHKIVVNSKKLKKLSVAKFAAVNTTIDNSIASNRTLLSKIVVPSENGSANSALDQHDFERGVCIPYRKYTPQTVSPAIIKSYYDRRIAGCPGGEGEDEHDVVWFWLEKGKPHECSVCSQYFEEGVGDILQGE